MLSLQSLSFRKIEIEAVPVRDHRSGDLDGFLDAGVDVSDAHEVGSSLPGLGDGVGARDAGVARAGARTRSPGWLGFRCVLGVEVWGVDSGRVQLRGLREGVHGFLGVDAGGLFFLLRGGLGLEAWCDNS